jgi:hypothetical protein
LKKIKYLLISYPKLPDPLKKVISIVVLLVFLFNVGGYYIVFWGLRFEADNELTARIDADHYKPSEIIEIKIPVTLPYPIQQDGYKRIDGRFEYRGEFFKLVKQKLQNDTLSIVCIRDHEGKKLENTMNEYVKLANSLPATNQKALNILAKLLKDFCKQVDPRILRYNDFAMRLFFADLSEILQCPLIAVPGPPPRA